MSIPTDLCEEMKRLGAAARAKNDAGKYKIAAAKVKDIISALEWSSLGQTTLRISLSAAEIELLEAAGLHALNVSGGRALVSFDPIPRETYDPKD